ncbi:glucose-6-phosphate exchanger SLC37A2 isoform X2 [Coccinella septempunctata]|uniref:glucose-6-phosphate exchanger SLC37A2 isoform X2 n=1 Tax=Coccinella septempunctata TaxID=41139 RepID=UPI001D05EA6B|nr:glucose-6-phosphate exchanger SLC37A2 isoform X2 [Coccinella septempunctata]
MSGRVRRRDVPLGVKFLQYLSNRCFPISNRERSYRALAYCLTFIAYICFHMCRKPMSVVKAVLHRNCSELIPPPGVPIYENSTWCDWAPFNGTDANASQKLGELDSAFLFSYAISMFMSGFIAERVNLRYFLSLGMLLSGIFCYMFGMGKILNVHVLSYYLIFQIFAGIVQTSGWPGVVTVMGNWYGKSKKGVIFGIWNSHTSFGNILGTVIAAAYVEKNWAYSFIVPGAIMGVVGFILFLFLVASPSDVGIVKEEDDVESQRPPKRLVSQVANGDGSSGFNSETDDTEILIGEQEVQRRLTERSLLIPTATEEEKEVAIGFFGAFKIPGVIEFSLCLFFAKLVSYTFLYWLPLYVNSSTTMGASASADLSTLFDVGGIIGGVAAGALSDQTSMSATVCSGMLALAPPFMLLYQNFSSAGLGPNIALLLIVGALVNGPYALITTVVSTELGTHSSLEGNSKALATVTAIIDGTGSIGAAVGPLLAGFVSGYGWQNVFYMLIVSDFIALLLLIRLTKNEISKSRLVRRRFSD